jgi:hypothetical protein
VKKNVTKTKERITETGEHSFFESFPDDYNFEEEIDKRQFMECLNKNLDRWIDNKHSTEEEKRTIMAIKILLDSIDDYECLNKKAFFIYMKDISGLSSKQLSNSLKKIKIRYTIFLDNWNHGIKQ